MIADSKYFRIALERPKTNSSLLFIFQAIVNAVQEILVGDSDVVLTGGSDNMSACPYAVRDIRSDINGIYYPQSMVN